MDNNTRCYEGIQRIYRNAVVRYLRTKMTAAFGQEALAKLREPFKREEWEAIEAAATSPRASGHLDAPVGDAFDLLSVNHFFNIFDQVLVHAHGAGTRRCLGKDEQAIDIGLDEGD